MDSLPMLEHLRRRLGWRKWYRNVGLAYQAAIDRETQEKEWLTANRLPDGSSHDLANDLRRLAMTELRGSETDTPLNRSIVDSTLLKHYQRYAAADSCARFRVWYGRCLSDDRNATPPTTWLDRAIRDYVRSYFAPTYRMDADVQAIDDSSLWYFAQCTGVAMRDIQEILTMPESTAALAFAVVRAGGGGEVISRATGLRAIDSWRWRIGPLRAKSVRLGWTRLAPLAAFVVDLVARSRGANISTLPTDRLEPAIDMITDNTNDDDGGDYATIVVTNLLVWDPPTAGFHLHAPNLLSVFLQPDQDPAVTHVLDPFVTDWSSNHTQPPSRWVVVSLNNGHPRDDQLIDLLRELPVHDASIDSQRSRTPPSTVAPNRSYLRSTIVVPRNVTMRDMALRYLRDDRAVMLHAHPRIGQYAPAASKHIFQSRPGLVPFSVNDARAFTFGAHTLGGEPRDRVTLADVAVMVQGSTELGWTMLRDARDIRDFFGTAMPSTATLVRTLRDPLPVRVHMVAKKRVFALDDGTVFLAVRQIMLPGPMTDVANLRYVRGVQDVPSVLKPRAIHNNPSFVRATLANSSPILFPVRDQQPRIYDTTTRELAPIVAWLDEQLSTKSKNK